MRYAWAQILLLALVCCGGLVHADVAVPPLTARVTDLTGTLDAAQKQQLETRLAQFEAEKGAQIAVLLIPTTDPETIEQYGIRVAEAWKLGRKGIDDGALLLIAKDDRALRIEVGYGLEGVLPDAVAKHIIAETITPPFKRGDFYSGIAAGIEQMMGVIEGEPLPPRERNAASGNYQNYESLLFVGFMLVMVVGGVLRSLFGRLPAAAVIGFAAAVLAWFIVAPLLIAGLVGIIAFFFTLAGGGRGHFGGGSFGGGLGGGGFGGGGGGFGGGGASGRW